MSPELIKARIKELADQIRKARAAGDNERVAALVADNLDIVLTVLMGEGCDAT